jgi:hypothetical protein
MDSIARWSITGASANISDAKGGSDSRIPSNIVLVSETITN